MAATLIVKITHGTEIRRFTSTSSTLTWSSLSKKVNDLFSLTKAFKLTYVDDEGDKITLSSEDEFTEAVSLALTTSPAVLRLSVTVPEADTRSFTTQADVSMADASTDAAGRPTADAGTHARPTTADAGTNGGGYNNHQGTNPNGADDPNLRAFLNTIASQLPMVMAQLPEHVRRFIPRAELDVAATIAANAVNNGASAAAAAASNAARVAQAAAAAGAAAAAAANHRAPSADAGSSPPGVHVGVTCDRSGQCPIVGNRYNLVGHNYDVCEAEYNKLTDREKALYHKIPPPFVAHIAAEAPSAAAAAAEADGGVHVGVECDRSGMCPIVGMRYNLRGNNYDLCQAEYDKLPAAEKLLYTAIPPPAVASAAAAANAAAASVAAFGQAAACGGPWRANGGWGGGGRGWGGGGCGAKLAARFVRDVTIFDGTQMAPSTKFTKIWRLKNIGEVAWPQGTRMLYVGGDQMTADVSVPLSRTGPVLPQEEVDVAVEMTAPSELGRYLGYWRLVGPHGRRKFGQRVWCHVQVVDPAAPVTGLGASDDDLKRVLVEIERKKSELAAADADPTDEDAMSVEPPSPGGAAGAAKAVAGAAPPPSLAPSPAPEPPAAEAVLVGEPVGDSETTVAAAAEAEAVAMSESRSDDGFALVNAADGSAEDKDEAAADDDKKDEAADKKAGAAAAAQGGWPGADDTSTPEGVKAALGAMGFTEAAMVDVVIGKHGADLDACARDLAAATEWDSLLDDLAEMGFGNRDLNKTLMLKHDGNVKRTVKALVEDSA